MPCTARRCLVGPHRLEPWSKGFRVRTQNNRLLITQRNDCAVANKQKHLKISILAQFGKACKSIEGIPGAITSLLATPNERPPTGHIPSSHSTGRGFLDIHCLGAARLNTHGMHNFATILTTHLPLAEIYGAPHYRLLAKPCY